MHTYTYTPQHVACLHWNAREVTYISNLTLSVNFSLLLFDSGERTFKASIIPVLSKIPYLTHFTCGEILIQ